MDLFFSSSSRARPRPRLDRSPANPSATPVIQVAISRARMSSMVVVGWFPCRIIFVGQMIVGNRNVAGVELFRALTSSSSLVCSSVNLVQIKARGKCCEISFYSFHDHGQMLRTKSIGCSKFRQSAMLTLPMSSDFRVMRRASWRRQAGEPCRMCRCLGLA